MNLTIKQIRAFAAVADLQSFSQAAQRLNLTAGAVSLLIRDLEAELGFALFDRTTRRVELTKGGRDLLPVVEQALHQIQAIGMAAHNVRQLRTGAVRVAVPQIVAQAMLPPAMARYQQINPGIVIRPIDCAAELLVQMVEAGQADLAIGPDRPTSERVERIALYESPWVLWCSAEHPLAQHDRITWAMLRNESVIAAGRDYETRIAEALNRMPEPERFVPAYVAESVTTALGIAAAGLGITLSPAYVGVVAQRMGLKMKRIIQPEITRELCVYRPSQKPQQEAATAFCDFLCADLVAHRFDQVREKRRRVR